MNNDKAQAHKFAGWQKLVRHYQQPRHRISAWQLINSFGGLMLSAVLMLLALQVSYWLVLVLALPAAGFLVRIFIIQHDCGHGSFFKSRLANDVVGVISSIFTLTPYRFWRKTHAIHHAHHAELEERGLGDVWTMTVDEYLQAPWWKRFSYRVFRQPIFLFLVAPVINFVVIQRFPVGAKRSWKTGEIASVFWTNVAIIGWLAVASVLLGVVPTLMLTLPIIIIAASAGTWMFYVQHQFERTYWEHTPHWDYTLAALQGSSYYKLPRVLQWFTGNIGFHHIHHLSPRIPNYNLERCHKENPLFQQVVQLTLLSSFKTALLALWDENKQRLVSFREVVKSKQPVIV